MTSQNIALWALINTQSIGGYSNRKKGRYRTTKVHIIVRECVCWSESLLSAKPDTCAGFSISLFLLHAKHNIIDDADDNNENNNNYYNY